MHGCGIVLAMKFSPDRNYILATTTWDQEALRIYGVHAIHLVRTIPVNRVESVPSPGRITPTHISLIPEQNQPTNMVASNDFIHSFFLIGVGEATPLR